MFCHTWLSALIAGRGTRAGDPLSWRHFKYGMAYLGRAAIARTLEQATATRSGSATEEGYERWRARLTPMIG